MGGARHDNERAWGRIDRAPLLCWTSSWTQARSCAAPSTELAARNGAPAPRRRRRESTSPPRSPTRATDSKGGNIHAGLSANAARIGLHTMGVASATDIPMAVPHGCTKNRMWPTMIPTASTRKTISQTALNWPVPECQPSDDTRLKSTRRIVNPTSERTLSEGPSSKISISSLP